MYWCFGGMEFSWEEIGKIVEKEKELCCIGLGLEVSIQTNDFIKIYIFLLDTKKGLRSNYV